MADAYITKIKRKYKKIKKAYNDIIPVNETKTKNEKAMADLTFTFIESIFHKDFSFERQASEKLLNGINNVKTSNNSVKYEEIKGRSIKLLKKIVIALNNSPNLSTKDVSKLETIANKLYLIVQSCDE